MTILRSKRGSLAIGLIFAAVGAFGILTAFEVKIAQVEARSDAASRAILMQEQLLRFPSITDLERRTLERGIAGLALRADPLAQEVGLVRALQRIASRRGVQLLAIRARPLDRVPKARLRFEARSYDVILEGAYRALLIAMSDLSRAPLVTRLEQIDLARAEGSKTAPSSVRAMLQLAILRLAADRNVRPHAP